jgi:hypothetical protein
VPSRIISGISGVKANRPTPMAMARATMPLPTTSHVVRPEWEWSSVLGLDTTEAELNAD